MTPARISGTTPGVLDPTQPQRLLRRPSSSLSFATFDPRVASADHGWDMRSLSLNEELYRPKRVVIETTCSGESSWRFVPRARWEEGVVDEGPWPRVIDLCGQLVECSQDQWDIYKLDPAYDCLVRAPPEVTVITVATPKPREGKRPLGKHRMSSPEPCPEMPPSKTFHLELDQDSEEDEVADMIVDDGARPSISRMPSAAGDRAKKFREEIEKNRKERREKAAARSERLATREDPIFFDFSGHQPIQPQHTGSPTLDAGPKRKVASLFDSVPIRPQDDPEYRSPEEEASRNTVNYSPTKTSKRTRTFSPGAAKRDLETRRLEREKKKREKRERELNQRKQQRFQHFLNTIYSEVSSHAGPSNNHADPVDVSDDSDSGEEDNPAAEVDAEAERQAFIAEARRKLAELEADKPLWEEEAKKRKKLEEQEQEAQRARIAERRAAEARKADEERKVKMEKERQQQAQVKEEARVRAGEERARRERERRQRNERWAYGPWTTQRALERYKTLSEIFDSTKFSPDDPITFDVVPWPILPVRFSVEDIDWAAVESFFNAVKPHMRSQDFASFVEKSHRRFHPDRWRSRGLLKSVADETERGCLEVAANTVAQALTPLWRDLTGR
ncbi:RING-type domain-containing protein [Mycena venus]|uniref:RING-type domain-containing protein n=1 Tax=Mycena venus TaxID=2733690 RepID=A0A8H7D585_9AGAR|nr:RING-type domain-containing protein [Mycena venus]